MDVPTSFETVFSKDAQCEDDPDGSIYPHRDTIVEPSFKAIERSSIAYAS
ncbi:MAG: hypothetical protein R3B96_18185 [Pirellulaceae bacterium]